jgi:hypothetical protein
VGVIMHGRFRRKYVETDDAAEMILSISEAL